MKIAGVSADWNRPDGTPRAILTLAPGAGGDFKDTFLRGIGAALADDAIATLRFNFPYREAGRRAPGSQKQSEECYRAVATHAREAGLPLFCGGKSYGGRMATHIVAEGFDVAGLVLLSYPLHPPGRPEKLRAEHLRDIGVPMLFVQGTRDPFATPELLRATIDSLADATLVPVEGGDHSLRVKGRSSSSVVGDVRAAIEAFFSRAAR